MLAGAGGLLMLNSGGGGGGGGRMTMRGVKLCTTAGGKSSLISAFWMVVMGARDTLLACGAEAPSSLSLAMVCLSDAFATRRGFNEDLKVLSDS